MVSFVDFNFLTFNNILYNDIITMVIKAYLMHFLDKNNIK